MGDFVPAGAPLIRVDGDSGRLDRDEVRGLIQLADERTHDTDPAFGFRKLVDIATRSIEHDPTTTVQALHRLHDALRQLAVAQLPSGRHCDDAGELRLLTREMTWEGYVRLAFDEFRMAGASKAQVARRLRAALEDLKAIAPADRQAILDQELALLENGVRRSRERRRRRRGSRRRHPRHRLGLRRHGSPAHNPVESASCSRVGRTGRGDHAIALNSSWSLCWLASAHPSDDCSTSSSWSRLARPGSAPTCTRTCTRNLQPPSSRCALTSARLPVPRLPTLDRRPQVGVCHFRDHARHRRVVPGCAVGTSVAVSVEGIADGEYGCAVVVQLQ